jgi:hypothetical protein
MSLFIENGLCSSTAGADAFISNDLIVTGVIHWVYSVTGNDSNDGAEATPLATLAQAITNATANNGDIIVIKSGHTETLTSAIALSKAGIKVFGLGSGSNAPKFTVNAACDGINITGANCEVNNLYFPVGTTAGNTGRINIGAAHVKVKGCTFMCGVRDQDSITIAAAGLYTEIDSCTFTVSADGPDSGVLIEAAAAVGIHIHDCAFGGATYNWDNGAIYSTFAHTEFIYQGNTLTGSACIVHTGTAKGWASGTVAGDGSFVRI